MKLQDRIEWKTPDTLTLAGMLIWVAAIIIILPYDDVFYRGDMLYFKALEYASRAALKQGQLPLWNPYFMEPLLANPQSMVLYPSNLLLRFLPMDLFFPVQTTLHVWLAGAALYLLLRHWDFSRLACLAGSAAVAFSTLVISHIIINHIAPLPVFAWSIFALLAYARLLHYGRFKDFLFTAAATVFLFLSGHTQISIIGLMLPGSYFVYYLIQKRSWQATLRALLQTTLIGIFSLGILAVQLIPFVEYLPITVRSPGYSFEMSANYSLNIVDIFNVFVPFGVLETSRNAGIAHELLYYTTVIMTGLVLVVFRFSPKDRRPLIRYVSIVAIVTILIALGKYTPVYRVVYLLAPSFRVPGRFLFLWILPAAVFIAMAIDTLAQSDQSGEKKWTLWLGLVFPIMIIIAIVMVGPYRSLPIRDLMPLIITGAMVIIAFVVLEIRQKFSTQTWLQILVAFIILDASIHGAYMALWPEYFVETPRTIGLDRAFACLANQIDLADGRLYSEDETKMDTVRAGAAQGILSYHVYSANTRYTREMYDSGSFGKYLLRTSFYVPLEDLSPTETQEILDTDCNLIVYKEQAVLPHVYAVNHLNVVDDDPESSLAMIDDASFNPLESAIISLPEGSNIPELAANESLQYEAEIAEYTSNKIVIDVTASQPALLVVSEAFYPGWRAVIDGEPTQIYRVNHGLEGIFINEGEQRVTISFQSESARNGLMVSLISLIGLVPVGLLWKKQDKREQKPTDPNAAANQGGGQSHRH